MTRYDKLSDSELDNLVMLSYHPKKREKLNLSARENFINIIMEKISDHNLQIDFGDCLINLIHKNIKFKKEEILPMTVYLTVVSEMRILKIAALMLYDENREIIK